MIVFPNCKINLGLNVVEKRSDGFHNIETCFYPLPLTDVLEAVPSDVLQFNASGITIPGNVDSNLCLRAYELLKRDHDLPPVSIHLHKVIPMGAGLGGGSSDGAFFLQLMNDMFSLSLSKASMTQYAEQLGSDCAFFLHNRPMLGSDKGQVLEPCEVSLRDKFIVLIKPDVHVATAEAYAGIKPQRAQHPIREIIKNSRIEDWKKLLVNDFEASVFQKHPSIAAIKESLYANGAVYAAMSGSGSSVFGIFELPVDLRHSFEGCFYWSGSPGY